MSVLLLGFITTQVDLNDISRPRFAGPISALSPSTQAHRENLLLSFHMQDPRVVPFIKSLLNGRKIKVGESGRQA
jgi:hypothetical protein